MHDGGAVTPQIDGSSVPVSVRALIRNLPVPAAVVDMEGHAVLWNAAAETILPPPLRRGDIAYPLFSLASQPWFGEVREQLLNSDSVSDIEWNVRGVGGIRTNLKLLVTAVRDGGEATNALLVLFEDITRRERESQRLARRVRARRRALNRLPAPLIVHRQGKIVYANHAASALFDLAHPRELIGLCLGRLFRPVKGGPDPAELKNGVIRGTITGDSVTRDVEMYATALGSGVRSATQVVFWPVPSKAQGTEAARRTEDQLRQAQRMEAIGRLAGGIAHDFNNLLTAIQGHVQLLMDALPPEHSAALDAVEIKKAAERAAALTGQLLAFSRRQALQTKIMDLNAVILDMEKLLRRVISENIEFITRLADDLGPIRADPGQIEQVIMNLVVNARDAMPNGGQIVIQTSNVELDASYLGQRIEGTAGPHVLLTVSDTGIGMDRETQAHIFEPFFTTKPAGKGTGLGLATVYGIVKQSGGHIYVYSEPGSGTTFKIYLPIVADQAGALPRAPRPVVDAGAGETVLVVEDETSVRGLARRILESRGFRVMEASTGEEALRILSHSAEPIDLLLTDMVMPDMGGHTLWEKLMSVRPQTRVVFMSGYSGYDVERIGTLPKGASFLEKPFTPDALVGIIRKTLDH